MSVPVIDELLIVVQNAMRSVLMLDEPVAETCQHSIIANNIVSATSALSFGASLVQGSAGFIKKVGVGDFHCGYDRVTHFDLAPKWIG
jgi:hypothetical protein